jgi:hypothetical protein
MGLRSSRFCFVAVRFLGLIVIEGSDGNQNRAIQELVTQPPSIETIEKLRDRL